MILNKNFSLKEKWIVLYKCEDHKYDSSLDPYRAEFDSEKEAQEYITEQISKIPSGEPFEVVDSFKKFSRNFSEALVEALNILKSEGAKMLINAATDKVRSMLEKAKNAADEKVENAKVDKKDKLDEARKSVKDKLSMVIGFSNVNFGVMEILGSLGIDRSLLKSEKAQKLIANITKQAENIISRGSEQAKKLKERGEETAKNIMDQASKMAQSIKTQGDKKAEAIKNSNKESKSFSEDDVNTLAIYIFNQVKNFK